MWPYRMRSFQVDDAIRLMLRKFMWFSQHNINWLSREPRNPGSMVELEVAVAVNHDLHINRLLMLRCKEKALALIRNFVTAID